MEKEAQHQNLHRVPFGRLMPLAFAIGIIGLAQYLAVTTWLMTEYPGGNLFDKSAPGYDFFRNFLSDLGRTRAFRVGPNPIAIYYALTLAIAGVSTIGFFGALGHFLFYSTRNYWAIPATICAVIAGGGYIGVALHPINVDYHGHIAYVQIGFIGFWLMGVFCTIAIFKSSVFPDLYGKVLLGFLMVLGVQIGIMLLGPRSWSNESALLLQVTAQKVVVYAEILAMLVVNIGAIRAYQMYRSRLTE